VVSQGGKKSFCPEGGAWRIPRGGNPFSKPKSGSRNLEALRSGFNVTHKIKSSERVGWEGRKGRRRDLRKVPKVRHADIKSGSASGKSRFL